MTDHGASDPTEEMTEALQQWQVTERRSMDASARVMEETRSPLIRLVMEIVRHDSLMHHRVQQFLLDSLRDGDAPVTQEDVQEVWDRITEHDRQEREAVAKAAKLRDQARSPIHKHLLDYLVADEEKHKRLLGILEEIKAGMKLASGA